MWESRTCAKAATAERTTPPVRRPRARLVVPRCSQIPLDQSRTGVCWYSLRNMGRLGFSFNAYRKRPFPVVEDDGLARAQVTPPVRVGTDELGHQAAVDPANLRRQLREDRSAGLS